jgi:hypothetical protein
VPEMARFVVTALANIKHKEHKEKNNRIFRIASGRISRIKNKKKTKFSFKIQTKF